METLVTKSVPLIDNGVSMEVDLKAERVDITNNTHGDLDLAGWKLTSEVGDQVRKGPTLTRDRALFDFGHVCRRSRSRRDSRCPAGQW